MTTQTYGMTNPFKPCSSPFKMCREWETLIQNEAVWFKGNKDLHILYTSISYKLFTILQTACRCTEMQNYVELIDMSLRWMQTPVALDLFLPFTALKRTSSVTKPVNIMTETVI